MIQFCQDVKKLLNKKPEDKDLPFPEMISLFNESCTQALNCHAPLLTKKIRDLPSTPGFDSQYKEARKRRKAEKTWKKSGLQSDYEIFNYLRSHCLI